MKRTSRKKTNLAAQGTQGGSHSTHPLHPSAIELTIHPPPAQAPQPSTRRRSLRRRQFSNQKNNSTPLGIQGGSSIQVPVTHNTHPLPLTSQLTTKPLSGPTPQPRSLKTKPFSSKKTKSAQIGIQGDSFIQVPGTHNTHPSYASTPQPTTQPALAPQSTKKTNLAAQGTQGGSHSTHPLHPSTLELTIHPPPAQAPQPSTQRRSLKRKRFSNKKTNSTPLGIQGGSSIQVPVTHNTHPPHALTPQLTTQPLSEPVPQPSTQLGSLKTKPFSSKKRRPTQIGIQGDSFIQVPATHNTHPSYASTLQPTTQPALAPQSRKKTNLAAQGTQGGSHSTHPLHPSTLELTIHPPPAQAPQPSTQRRSLKRKQFSNKKTNSTPLGIQGGSSIQVPVTHNTHSPHALTPQLITQPLSGPTPQPRSLKTKPLSSKKTKSKPIRIQSGSFIQVPATRNTHPPYASAPQPTTQPAPPQSSTQLGTLKCIPSKKANSASVGTQGGSHSTTQPSHALVPQRSTQPPPTPTPQLNPEPPSAPSPQHSSQPSVELHYDGEEEEEEGEGEDIETPVQRVKPRKGWLVDVIDEHGTIKTKELTANDVLSLPHNERIVLHWNNEGQPIGEGGGLLNRFLGLIGRDFELFPVCYCSWKRVPEDYKKTVFEEEIRTKFVTESDIQKSYIYKSLGSKWRERRQQLWQARVDKAHNRDELIAMVPDGINRDQWALFVDYRLDPKTKVIAQKNKENRMKQNIPHTAGSKTLARKRAEMEMDFGRKVSRGEVWTATHTHANGEFVNDEAREISDRSTGWMIGAGSESHGLYYLQSCSSTICASTESPGLLHRRLGHLNLHKLRKMKKIQEYEKTMSPSQNISTQDSLARALGNKEHFGRVRGLGLGPCPSQVFGHPARYYSGMASTLPYMELQNQVIALQSQVAEQNKKFDTLMNFIQNFQDQRSSDLAMFQTLPVSDEGSAH